MADFSYVTKTGRSPQGKQRVYFTCHPDDFEKCFEDICGDILKNQDCAVYYLDPEVLPEEVEDYELQLSSMQLFVIPVTSVLLTENCRTMDTELPLAGKYHIPVLPVMMEKGLAEAYKTKFGRLQYLARNNTDPTAIPYEEKLKSYLESVLVGDELAEKVRSAFDAYIFLSYRKKDRKYANELMRLIHKTPRCRDIAIWYDEFLTPGEDFSDAIRDALLKCDLFALTVTPNVVERDNYVMRIEFPMAVKEEKPILPVEMNPTSTLKYNIWYRQGPRPVKGDESGAFFSRLTDLLKDIAFTEHEKDPEHNFFIGLAYLQGIDVETDYERALELIRGAAEEDFIPAAKKLTQMYAAGEGTDIDPEKWADWSFRLAKLYKKEYRKNQDEDTAYELLQSLWGAAAAFDAYGQYEKEKNVLEEMRGLCETFLKKYRGDRFSYAHAECCRSLASLAGIMQDHVSEEKYAREALKIDQARADRTRSVRDRRCLASDYDALGVLAHNMGQLDQAAKWYKKSYDIARKLEKETGSLLAREDLAGTLCALGSLAQSGASYKEAERYFLEALKVQESAGKIAGETADPRKLAEIYAYLGDLAFQRKKIRNAAEWHIQAVKIATDIANAGGMLLDRKTAADNMRKLGKDYMFGGMDEQAETFIKLSLQVHEQIRKETETLEAGMDSAEGCFSMGDLYTMQKRYAEADQWYRESYEIQEEVLKDTDTPVVWRLLSRTCSMLGNLGFTSLDPVKRGEAIEWHRKALDMDLKLAEALGTPQSYDDLACSYSGLGGLTNDISLKEKALSIWQDLRRKYPEEDLYRERVETEISNIEKVRAYLKRNQ